MIFFLPRGKALELIRKGVIPVVSSGGLRKILETYFFIFFLPRGMDIQCTIKYHFKFSLFNSTSLELPMAKVT